MTCLRYRIRVDDDKYVEFVSYNNASRPHIVVGSGATNDEYFNKSVDIVDLEELVEALKIMINCRKVQ